MEEKIKLFLEKETGHAISDDGLNLIEAGIVDSFSMMRLIGFLEQEFGVALNLEELSPENFNSIAGIAEFIRKSPKKSL